MIHTKPNSCSAVSKSTVIIAVIKAFPCRIFAPAGDLYEVGHKARDLALEDGGIAQDDALGVSLE